MHAQDPGETVRPPEDRAWICEATSGSIIDISVAVHAALFVWPDG